MTTHAALLSLHMRLDPHTHYAFTPVFREQTFARSGMERPNQAGTTYTHPKGARDADLIPKAEQERRKGGDEKELSRMRRDEALVQITLFPGVVACRRGGWETPDSIAEKVRYEKGCEGRGVRVRRLTEAWVYC